MATHSSILAQEIPWREEPGRLIVHGIAKSQTHLVTNNQEQIHGVYLKIIFSLDNGVMNDLYLLPYAFLYVLIYFPIFLLL